MNDQAQNLRNLVYQKQYASTYNMNNYTNRNDKCHIIAITSGKGGVGKTNLTVNLAIAMAQRGKRVLIIDADLGMANVDVIIGSTSPYSLLHLVEDNVNLEDVISTGPSGIKYLSGGSGIEKLANLEMPEFVKITQKLAHCDDLADIVLIDTGAGLSKNVLNFLLAADEVILITTPEPTAMTDAYAMMKAYSLYAEDPCMRLVVNRLFEAGESEDVFLKLIKTAERFLKLQVTPLGEIYEDRNMVKAVKAQMPLMIMYPNTIAARGIRTLADNLLNGGYSTVSKGLKGFLEKFLIFLR